MTIGRLESHIAPHVAPLFHYSLNSWGGGGGAIWWSLVDQPIVGRGISYWASDENVNTPPPPHQRGTYGCTTFRSTLYTFIGIEIVFFVMKFLLFLFILKRPFFETSWGERETSKQKNDRSGKMRPKKSKRTRDFWSGAKGRNYKIHILGPPLHPPPPLKKINANK